MITYLIMCVFLFTICGGIWLSYTSFGNMLKEELVIPFVVSVVFAGLITLGTVLITLDTFNDLSTLFVLLELSFSVCVSTVFTQTVDRIARTV